MTELLDQFEAMLVSIYGERVYHWGPLSPVGSIVNVGVAGVLLLGGIAALFTRSGGFSYLLIVIGAILLTLFSLFAVRVHTGRTLFDRELAAEIEAEERAQNGENA